MANSPGQITSSRSKGWRASLKACQISNVDRISNLPDALILQIFSFLSTKQAVATSVLSKKWVRLWTLVPALNLQDSDICSFDDDDQQSKLRFVHIIYRSLLLNKAGYVEKLRLRCHQDYGQPFISTWICSAMERGLQHVDINVSRKTKLPGGLFSMKTLKILKLLGGSMVDVIPVSVCLPNLKILHLLWVKYSNVKSISRLISGCLNLEDLRVEVDVGVENPVDFNISIHTLNSLSLTLENCYVLPNREIRVEINTPSLKNLKLSFSGNGRHQYIAKTFPYLVDANIFTSGSYGTEQIRVLNGVKCLKLHGTLDHFAWVRYTPNNVDFFLFFYILIESFM